MTVPRKSKPSRRDFKAVSEGAGQIPSRPAKKTRTIVPRPQAERIIYRYGCGQSIRKIAREEKRDQGTVTKIVRSDEMLAYSLKLHEQYFGLGELAVDGVRRGIENSNDGRLAHEVLRNLGAIPNSEEANAMQQQAQQSGSAVEDTEEQRVKAEMLKLVNVAYERAKIFGGPLPTLDEPEITANESIESQVDELERDL